MIKKASLLVLTGAITISSLGLTTTSFADVREENLLVQEMNAKSKNQVVTEQDGTVRVAGEDGQLGTADDVLVKPGLNGQAPQIDQFGNVTLPTGGRVIFANGTIVTDHVNEHSIITPGGSVVTPNDKGGAPTVNADGSVNVPEGSMVVLSSGGDTTPPKDSVVSSNGDITTLSGVSIKANGTVVAPGPDGKVGTADDVLVKPFIDPDVYPEIPTVDEFGNITLPIDGHVELPDGTIVTDRGDEQSIIVPGGTVITPNGNGDAPTVNTDGSVNVPAGSMVVLPNGNTITPQNGSTVGTNGTVEFPDGTKVTDSGDNQSIITPRGYVVTPNDKGDKPIIDANGNVKVPDGSNVVLPNGKVITPENGSTVGTDGTIKNPDGSVTNPDGSVTSPGGDTNPAIQFTDISKHWAESTIKSFVNSKYINGYNDGTFRPDNLITRAEFVKILNKYFGLTNKSGKVFSDTSSHWAKEEIDIAVTNGIVNGFPDGTFKPEAPITREQASVMISNYKQISDKDLDKLNTYKDSSEVSDWAQASVEGVLEQGYMSGYPDKTFGPKKNLTRAEAVVTLSRIAK